MQIHLVRVYTSHRIRSSVSSSSSANLLVKICPKLCFDQVSVRLPVFLPVNYSYSYLASKCYGQLYGWSIGNMYEHDANDDGKLDYTVEPCRQHILKSAADSWTVIHVITFFPWLLLMHKPKLWFNWLEHETERCVCIVTKKYGRIFCLKMQQNF